LTETLAREGLRPWTPTRRLMVYEMGVHTQERSWMSRQGTT